MPRSNPCSDLIMCQVFSARRLDDSSGVGHPVSHVEDDARRMVVENEGDAIAVRCLAWCQSWCGARLVAMGADEEPRRNQLGAFSQTSSEDRIGDGWSGVCRQLVMPRRCATCACYIAPNKPQTKRGLCSAWDLRSCGPRVMPEFSCDLWRARRHVDMATIKAQILLVDDELRDLRRSSTRLAKKLDRLRTLALDT